MTLWCIQRYAQVMPERLRSNMGLDTELLREPLMVELWFLFCQMGKAVTAMYQGCWMEK